ncbi:ATP-binding protein [Streptomyces luteogriseus]|uniref:ATP-binding protein n=1 Tax=Streptomyces luteogriseus TaxID=68233 RepID=UPI00369EF5E8
MGGARFASNAPFVGPPGVGKTMLPVARGRAAVDAGHRVNFTTAAELAASCHKAALEGRWKTCMRFFAGPKLLIIDELGYLPLPEDAASALYDRTIPSSLGDELRLEGFTMPNESGI